MINWMQKNKKYLIPTIWVSTIAFIGAGSVGWGAYNLNKNKATAVAKVGDTPITIKEFQKKYSNLYNYFSAISGGMTQEEADNMKLDQIALNESVKDTMKLNFAHDLGIDGLDKDIAKYLITMPEFQEDGKFNESLYKSSLTNLQIKPSDFEQDLKNNIIVDKLYHALNLPANDKDLELLASAYFMEDRLSLEVIEIKPEDINATLEEVKEFWENNKNNYITSTSYDIDTYFLPVDGVDVDMDKVNEFWEDNKNKYINNEDKLMSFEEAKDRVIRDYKFNIAKSDALKKYLSLKNEKEQPTDHITISEDDMNFPIENIVDKEIGEFVKPFEYENGYLIAKITKINQPTTMNFEQAKEMAEDDYKEEKLKKQLEHLAKQALENFEGKDIGFVSRESIKSLDNLSQDEFAIILNEIFNTADQTEGYVDLDNKVIVYKITDQRLADANIVNQNKEKLEEMALGLKNVQLQQDLLNLLQKRYKVEYYYKGSSLE